MALIRGKEADSEANFVAFDAQQENTAQEDKTRCATGTSISLRIQGEQ
jgi:translation initiation factor 1 (eIF-1/SUI1)